MQVSISILSLKTAMSQYSFTATLFFFPLQMAPHDFCDPVFKQARSISGKSQGGQAQTRGLLSGIRALSNTSRTRGGRRSHGTA